MTPTVASSYPSKFRKQGLLCVGCAPPLPPADSPPAASGSDSQAERQGNSRGTRDSEQHILEECWAYSDLRDFKSLRDAGDKRIVDYFRAVIQRRTEQNGA